MSFDIIKNFGPASIIQSFGKVSFTFSDSLDILLMGILIYAALKLIYETRSFPIIIGLSAVFFFYGLATFLNLPLTRNILQSFLSVFIILMAVIFQGEFRRFFSYFNLAPRISAKKKLPSEQIIEILSETMDFLAKRKTGALIVFPGKESIDQHLTSGYDLDGAVSAPLLLSIFDDSTPGHDGAVIIEGNNVKKFGVHLPLARNIELIQGFGTRHRAALGLSERSDALVVVVSEERGVISLAQNGKLKTVKDEAALEAVVNRFYREKFPDRDVSQIISFGLKNAGLILFTILIAAGVWVYSNQNSPLVQKNFVIPLEFQNVPANLVVSDVVPEEVVVTLEARGGNFQDLNSDEIRVPIDVSNARTGWRQFLVDTTKIKIPFNFTLVKVDPEKASLLIEKKEDTVPSSPRPRP